MLRKLLKHEFRATARVMIPLYLITVLLAVLTRATALWAEMVTFDGMLGRNFLALLSGIIIFGFVLALIATFVVAVILAILRFRSNLMADEGYVMFTLPVSTHTLVWSKLIVSAVWFLGAVVVDVLSLLALVANVEMFWELGRVFQEIADQWNAYYVGNGVAFLVECLLLFLVFCVVACLEFYTPLAIGHSFAQHKMLLSVAFFFAIQVVTQIVSGMLLFAGVPMLDSMDGWLNSLTPATAIHGFMWGSILISAIYGAIHFCITFRMLPRNLNVEQGSGYQSAPPPTGRGRRLPLRGGEPAGALGGAVIPVGAAALFQAADIVDLGISHVLQPGDGPGTGLSPISVNKEGDRQIGQNLFGPGELLQGKVSAFRDSLARVRFPGADVQQHRARRGLIVANAPVDVDTEQMRKNAHKNSFLRDALRPLAGGRAAVLFLV